jgi:uncharacterized protein YlaN (UPF0358 family)
MSARKEAKELVEKYYQSSPELFGTSKAMDFAIRMSLISINDRIYLLSKFHKPEYTMIQLEDSFIDLYEYKDYCEEVKKEIELL